MRMPEILRNLYNQKLGTLLHTLESSLRGLCVIPVGVFHRGVCAMVFFLTCSCTQNVLF